MTTTDNIIRYLTDQINLCEQYKNLFFESYALKGMLNFYKDYGKNELLNSLKRHSKSKDFKQRYFFNSEYNKIINIEP